jgi:hypothetical protein
VVVKAQVLQAVAAGPVATGGFAEKPLKPPRRYSPYLHPSDGPEGLPIHQVYVEPASQIERRLCVSMVLNREKGHSISCHRPAWTLKKSDKTPEKLIRVDVRPARPAGLALPP